MRVMTECFAEEFLRLGHSPAEVMALFRASEYRLANHAWQQLGEVKVFTIVSEVASAFAGRRASKPAAEASHA
jgi:hypothetical protein